MKKYLIVLATMMAFSVGAQAQEFGLNLGFNLTSADVSTAGHSVDSKLGVRLGLVTAMDMTKNLKFRSGLTYSQRRFDDKHDGQTTAVNLDYVDIPALVQYNFNDTVAVHGGLIFAFNIDKSYSGGGLSGHVDGVKDIYPLAQVGVDFLFNDLFGLEAYYERGLGGLATDMKNMSIVGANFIYWTL